MEKSIQSSRGDSTVTTSSSSSNHRDANLNHLNKISHKISKPIRRPPPPLVNDTQNPPPGLQPHGGGGQSQVPTPQLQPPVYNINKNDFRDLVQRLTGSPAHERLSAAPTPIQQPKPPSSRLQRIRPPPLAQISNRPPGLPQIGSAPSGHVMNCAPAGNPAGVAVGTSNGFFGGERQPLSPLPPFPAVHAAAESPISAYMRFLHSSMSSSSSSPRWNNVLPPPPPPPAPLQQQNIPPPTQTSMHLPQFPTLPASPLPFGCLPSPRSSYPLLSPSLLLSPNGQLGCQQLPLSPTVALPSPKWKGI